MEKCTNHTREVWGSGHRKYTVSLSNGVATCTCMSYVIGKRRANTDNLLDQRGLPMRAGVAWCKHIEAQFATLCCWQGEPIVSGFCDECLHPTEKVPDES